MKNYYKILEVSENASIEIIEKAYKVLVRKYHPDLQGNSPKNEAKIREINEAYSVLSDPYIKEQYDKEFKLENQIREFNNFQESDYSRMYREQQRLKYELAHEKYDKERISHQKQEIENEKKQEENTASYGMIYLLKGIFRHRPTMKSIKNLKRIDLLALFLTIVIVITIGLILYFLPFTHDWMYDNFLNTPLTSWIFKSSSK